MNYCVATSQCAQDPPGPPPQQAHCQSTPWARADSPSQQRPLQPASGFSKHTGESLERISRRNSGAQLCQTGGKGQNSSSRPTIFQEQDVSWENVVKSVFAGLCNSIKIASKTNRVSGRLDEDLSLEITKCSDSNLFSSVLRDKREE